MRVGPVETAVRVVLMLRYRVSTWVRWVKAIAKKLRVMSVAAAIEVRTRRLSYLHMKWHS